VIELLRVGPELSRFRMVFPTVSFSNGPKREAPIKASMNSHRRHVAYSDQDCKDLVGLLP
jgi:hypothetical protein